MDETDVAPRHRELGPAVGGLFVVAQTALEITAVQADAAKLHIGFGEVGRIADGGQKRLFRAHEIALAEQGHAEVVVMVGAAVVFPKRGLQVRDIFVKVAVLVLHRSVLLS